MLGRSTSRASTSCSLHKPALARIRNLLRLLFRRHELRAGKRGEAAVFRDEFVEAPLLNDLAGIEHEDAVGVADRR